jgi:hypothetical protein
LSLFSCFLVVIFARRLAEALLAQERHDYEQKLRDMELAQLQDLMRGPAIFL